MVFQTYDCSYSDTWRSRTASRDKNGIKDDKANGIHGGKDRRGERYM